MKIIGISGFARSGKDLFTTVAQRVLKEHGLKTERYALAYELKSDLKDLIKTRNISSSINISRSVYIN